MQSPFPAINSVILVGRLSSHRVENGTGFVDLGIETENGCVHQVRIEDKILAASVEPLLSNGVVLQVLGSLADPGAAHQVVVAHGRGHDIRTIGFDAAGAPAVRNTPEPITATPEPAKAHRPGTRPWVRRPMRPPHPRQGAEASRQPGGSFPVPRSRQATTHFGPTDQDMDIPF